MLYSDSNLLSFRLLWERHVNRSDLIEAFGISVPQSTLDFREYLERAPGNMDYDKRRKFYFPTATFKPIFISASAEVYLAQLATLQASEEIQSPIALIGEKPAFDILPVMERRVDVDTLQKLLKATRAELSLEINYQSLSSESPGWRRISPHALVSDGMRWHVRAYCHTKKQFRDFVLGRIVSIRDEQPSEVSQVDDEEWNEMVSVSIAPNPALSLDQQKIIARDYEMKQGKTVLILRKALLFYVKTAAWNRRG